VDTIHRIQTDFNSVVDLDSEKPSALKREHPSLKKMKFINFLLFLWVIFSLLDPDHESGSGSRDPVEFVSIPDPQHCRN
jgi:hypothetical protein